MSDIDSYFSLTQWAVMSDIDSYVSLTAVDCHVRH